MTEPTKEKFEQALDVLIDGCMDSMNPVEFIPALKKWLVQMRLDAMPSEYDDKYNAERGLPPQTEGELRRSLCLEDYEPLPPKRP